MTVMMKMNRRMRTKTKMRMKMTATKMKKRKLLRKKRKKKKKNKKKLKRRQKNRRRNPRNRKKNRRKKKRKRKRRRRNKRRKKKNKKKMTKTRKMKMMKTTRTRAMMTKMRTTARMKIIEKCPGKPGYFYCGGRKKINWRETNKAPVFPPKENRKNVKRPETARKSMSTKQKVKKVIGDHSYEKGQYRTDGKSQKPRPYQLPNHAPVQGVSAAGPSGSHNGHIGGMGRTQRDSEHRGQNNGNSSC